MASSEQTEPPLGTNSQRQPLQAAGQQCSGDDTCACGLRTAVYISCLGSAFHVHHPPSFAVPYEVLRSSPAWRRFWQHLASACWSGGLQQKANNQLTAGRHTHRKKGEFRRSKQQQPTLDAGAGGHAPHAGTLSPHSSSACLGQQLLPLHSLNCHATFPPGQQSLGHHTNTHARRALTSSC